MSSFNLISSGRATELSSSSDYSDLFIGGTLRLRLHLTSELTEATRNFRTIEKLEYFGPLPELNDVFTIEDSGKCLLISNWRGGITCVQFNSQAAYVITGFGTEGEPFKRYCGSLLDEETLKRLPWIELPHLKEICDSSLNRDFRNILQSILQYGKSFLSSQKESNLSLALSNIPILDVSNTQRKRARAEYWVDWLTNASSELLSNRHEVFAFMLSLFHQHADTICQELDLAVCKKTYDLFGHNPRCFFQQELRTVLTALEVC